MNNGRISSWTLVAVSLATASARAEPGSPPVPCIDTHSRDVAMTMERCGPDTQEPQLVHGALLAWNPDRATVTFTSYLSDEVEEIAVKSLGFRGSHGSEIAQTAPPRPMSLGPLSISFPANEVSVRDMVLMFPGCAAQHDGYPLLFVGKVTLSAAVVEVHGTVIELRPPPPASHSSNTTISK